MPGGGTKQTPRAGALSGNGEWARNPDLPCKQIAWWVRVPHSPPTY